MRRPCGWTNNKIRFYTQATLFRVKRLVARQVNIQDCRLVTDLVADALIEVAALVTDSELNSSVTAWTSSSGRRRRPGRRWTTSSATMHTKSGLLEEVRGATTIARREEQVLAYIREWVPEPRKAPAVRQHGRHRPWLPRPRHARARGHLHYRIIDVSSIKELARRWYPRAYFGAPKKSGGHRALADIRESIAELRYYREASSSHARAGQHDGQGHRRAAQHRRRRGPGPGPGRAARRAARRTRRGIRRPIIRAAGRPFRSAPTESSATRRG